MHASSFPTIYLLRHGETVWNTAGRFQGRLDSDLTARGLRQADAMGATLAKTLGPSSRDFILKTSPLGRTWATARIVAQWLSNLDIEEDELLREVSIGSWEGMTRFEVEMEHPQALVGATSCNWYFRVPDGESLDEACHRAKTWLGSLTAPTIAIGHGLFGRILRGVYLELSPADALQFQVRQDGFYCLDAGQERFVAAEPSDP